VKKLGLIGGTGPESTIPYYRDIVFGVKERVGEPYFPNLCIESLSVFEVFNFCKTKDYEGLTSYLAKGIENLAAAGADVAALTGNTPHIVFEELEKRTSIPIISSIQSTCAEVQKRNYTKIGLLGTITTMKEDFFIKPFEQANISVIVPNEIEMDYIGEKIETELEMGIVNEETRTQFFSIIQRMVKESEIEAVVLGCTEIPLLFKNQNLPVVCLDTMQIHIQTLIDYILT
jgi:aspartate racemase